MELKVSSFKSLPYGVNANETVVFFSKKWCQTAWTDTCITCFGTSSLPCALIFRELYTLSKGAKFLQSGAGNVLKHPLSWLISKLFHFPSACESNMVMEDPVFIDEFPIKMPRERGFHSLPCLITAEYSKVSTHGCGDGGKDSVCVAMLTEEQSHAAKFPGLQVFTPDHNQGERAHRALKSQCLWMGWLGHQPVEFNFHFCTFWLRSARAELPTGRRNGWETPSVVRQWTPPPMRRRKPCPSWSRGPRIRANLWWTCRPCRGATAHMSACTRWAWRRCGKMWWKWTYFWCLLSEGFQDSKNIEVLTFL